MPLGTITKDLLDVIIWWAVSFLDLEVWALDLILFCYMYMLWYLEGLFSSTACIFERVFKLSWTTELALFIDAF